MASPRTGTGYNSLVRDNLMSSHGPEGCDEAVDFENETVDNSRAQGYRDACAFGHEYDENDSDLVGFAPGATKKRGGTAC